MPSALPAARVLPPAPGLLVSGSSGEMTVSRAENERAGSWGKRLGVSTRCPGSRGRKPCLWVRGAGSLMSERCPGS